MPQWAPQSLACLCISFLSFLCVFNGASLAMGQLVCAVPFDIAGDGYEVSVTDLSLWNLPIYIESVPVLSETATIQIWCGEGVMLQNVSFSLKQRHFLNPFSVCETVTIRVTPRFQNAGLWLRGNSPKRAFAAFITRALFICAVAAGFYLLFRRGKNNSVMRSILITQTSVILILDPLYLMSSFFPSLWIVHALVFCIGWWRAVVEIFAEYGPLVRMQKASVYRSFAAVPTVILLSVILMSKLLNTAFLAVVGLAGLLMVPTATVAFLVKARHISGMRALLVHMVSGAASLSVVYLVNLFKVVDTEFRDSLFCETLETSFAGAYALFQTIFQFGGSTRRPHTGTSQSTIRRYEAIDGMLDAIGDFGNDVNFALSSSSEPA